MDTNKGQVVITRFRSEMSVLFLSYL